MQIMSRGTTKSSQTILRPRLLIILSRMQFVASRMLLHAASKAEKLEATIFEPSYASYVIFHRTRVRHWCHFIVFCIVSYALHKYDYDHVEDDEVIVDAWWTNTDSDNLCVASATTDKTQHKWTTRTLGQRRPLPRRIRSGPGVRERITSKKQRGYSLSRERRELTQWTKKT